MRQPIDAGSEQRGAPQPQGRRFGRRGLIAAGAGAFFAGMGADRVLTWLTRKPNTAPSGLSIEQQLMYDGFSKLVPSMQNTLGDQGPMPPSLRGQFHRLYDVQGISQGSPDTGSQLHQFGLNVVSVPAVHDGTWAYVGLPSDYEKYDMYARADGQDVYTRFGDYVQQDGKQVRVLNVARVYDVLASTGQITPTPTPPPDMAVSPTQVEMLFVQKS